MKTLFVLLLLAIAVLYPTTEDLTIVKSEITTNKPFAGTINNNLVGIDISCAYWLKPDSIDEVTTYRVTSPLLLKWLGAIYSTEVL